MLLSDFIERKLDTAYPFFTDDAVVDEVFAFMRQEHFESAPVLHGGKVKAMVTIMDILEVVESKKMKGRTLFDLHLQPAGSVGVHEHLFDLFERLDSFSGSVIPVTDDDGRYAGIIEKRLVLEKFSEVFHLGEDSMTLELNVPSSGLKLSEVIAAFEKNDAMVLSSGMYRAVAEGQEAVVTFRIQTHDWFRLVKNIEKYGYSINYASSLSRQGDDELREKALEFIRMMDM
jgi:CBS domain-containing protein